MFSTKCRWFICNPFEMQFSPLHSLEHNCNYLNDILLYFRSMRPILRWTTSEANCKWFSTFMFVFFFKSIFNLFSFSLSSVKPSLKKVTKQENKFANLQKKAAAYNFRQNLKVVTKSEFTIKDEDKTGVSLILKKMRLLGTFFKRSAVNSKSFCSTTDDVIHCRKPSQSGPREKSQSPFVPRLLQNLLLRRM